MESTIMRASKVSRSVGDNTRNFAKRVTCGKALAGGSQVVQNDKPIPHRTGPDTIDKDEQCTRFPFSQRYCSRGFPCHVRSW